MISWRDTAFILSTAPFNERDMMVELLTREHGRIRSIAKFGATKKQRPLFQAGNQISVTWSARQEHQMGKVQAEIVRGYLAAALANPLALTLMQSANMLCLTFLYEHDEATLVYEALERVYGQLASTDNAAIIAEYLRFEVELLSACGFRLDLSACVATGATEDLRYISPKSGCAVSGSAGEPYKSKLFAYPRWYAVQEYHPNPAELLDALALNAYFLQARLCAENDKTLPDARARIEPWIKKHL